MNVSELRQAFYNIIDDTIDSGIVLDWFNEAQEDAALHYGVKRSVSVTYDGENAITLPTDWVTLQEVRNSDGDTYLDFDITEWREISFDVADTYTLYYLGLPATIPTGDDTFEPELHPLLHRPLYIYAASRYFDMESGGDQEESNMALKYLNYYNAMVTSRAAKLKAVKQQRMTFL